MKTLIIKTHAKDADSIAFEWVEKSTPMLTADECLIKIATSGINPSDALATLGYFKNAVTPRIPGRDFSGEVVKGPTHMIGKKVWGTGGGAGIEFDGTQAEYIKLPAAALAEIPYNIDLLTAGGQTLPYTTAYYSLVKRAQIKPYETVLVVGALGQVGRAAMSICQWKNSNAIALVRGKEELAQALKLGWIAINSEEANLKEKILAANNDLPVNIILNSVGNIYWQAFIESLAEFGRIVTIGARENAREATLNLFELYRSNQEIIGINTIAFDFNANAKFLNEMKSGFEQNKLTPLAVEKSMIYPPEQAVTAYQEVLQGKSGKRVVIQFN